MKLLVLSIVTLISHNAFSFVTKCVKKNYSNGRYYELLIFEGKNSSKDLLVLKSCHMQSDCPTLRRIGTTKVSARVDLYNPGLVFYKGRNFMIDNGNQSINFYVRYNESSNRASASIYDGQIYHRLRDAKCFASYEFKAGPRVQKPSSNKPN